MKPGMQQMMVDLMGAIPVLPVNDEDDDGVEAVRKPRHANLLTKSRFLRRTPRHGKIQAESGHALGRKWV